MSGTANETKLEHIIRDHDIEKFKARKATMTAAAAAINEKYGEDIAELELKHNYYNMEQEILPCYHLIENTQLSAK